MDYRSNCQILKKDSALAGESVSHCNRMLQYNISRRSYFQDGSKSHSKFRRYLINCYIKFHELYVNHAVQLDIILNRRADRPYWSRCNLQLMELDLDNSQMP